MQVFAVSCPPRLTSIVYARSYIYMMVQELVTTLAEPARFRIVEMLRDGEQTVSAMVGRMQIQQSGVSRHLGILLEAGAVQVRREGQRRYYSLRPEPFQQLDAWLAGYRSLWEARLDRLGAEIARRMERDDKPKSRN